MHRRPARAAVETLEPRRLLTAIASDQTIFGSIGVVGETDDYTVQANAGESIIAAVGETVSTGFDPGIAIIAPDGTVLSSDFDQIGDNAAAYDLPQTGTYTVQVRDGGGNETGDYAVTMVKLPGPQTPGDDGGVTQSGRLYQGTIGPGDLDVYQIPGVAGGSLELAVGDGTSGGMEPGVILLGPDGAFIDERFSGNPFTGTNLGVTDLPLTGTYYAVVLDAASDETGDYGFTATSFGFGIGQVADDGGSTDAESGRLYDGSIVPGDIDVYTVSGDLGGSIVVAFGDGNSGGMDPAIQIFGPDGSQVASRVAGNPFTGTNLAAYDLPFSGTYTVAVRDGGSNEFDDYGLTIVTTAQPQVGDDGGAVAVQSGAFTAGAITPGDLDVFTIDGGLGGSLYVDFGDGNPGGMDPTINIFGPDGSLLNEVIAGNPFTGVAAAVDALPIGGTYTVVVRDSGSNEFDDYGLTVFSSTEPQVGNGGGDTTAVLNGEVVRDRVRPGDVGVYTIDAVLGGSLVAGMGDGNTGGMDPNLRVYGPDGSLIVTEASGNPFVGVRAFVENLPLTGTYTVIARDSGSNEFGRYGFSAFAVPGPVGDVPLEVDNGPLPAGQTRSGSTVLGDHDVYTFDVAAGDAFAVNVSKTAGSGYTPRLRVFGADGALLDSTTDGSTNVPAAPSGGTYYAVVSDNGYGATGSYTIALNAAAGSDVDAPRVLASQFAFETGHAIEFDLNEAAVGLEASDFEVVNLTTGVQYLATLDFDAGFNRATLTFPAAGRRRAARRQLPRHARRGRVRGRLGQPLRPGRRPGVLRPRRRLQPQPRGQHPGPADGAAELRHKPVLRGRRHELRRAGQHAGPAGRAPEVRHRPAPAGGRDVRRRRPLRLTRPLSKEP